MVRIVTLWVAGAFYRLTVFSRPGHCSCVMSWRISGLLPIVEVEVSQTSISFVKVEISSTRDFRSGWSSAVTSRRDRTPLIRRRRCVMGNHRRVERSYSDNKGSERAYRSLAYASFLLGYTDMYNREDARVMLDQFLQSIY